ncbi:TetR family transcriptional regulator C-terminal domain-containing protein [Mycobacterium sp. MYCO198283]|uniref:TetR/AcrR family transcriptional regulator n=1 Tax=Mycobacterium sp. MYCO198283 TaxID=2883505 RepID=UPI001E2FCC10|nr:TetR family transcriptional regulator C-terminal domain-containing protein [Mycobacterium sp. MYCO198283]MCG5432823.1 TetR family transcriptional regulator C-terminal domain-containing protein [Mycobacterium sp. MYCO198283]
MSDAAIDLLGSRGAREVSHGKVDRHANVPAGTTSFYFRTRRALLLGVAERMTELDVADLSRMTELAGDPTAGYTGTRGLAALVMASSAEPYLTRTRARYELTMQASREPELAALLERFTVKVTDLVRQVIRDWHGDAEPAAGTVDERAAMLLALINGVMMSFTHGTPVVADVEQLDAWIQTILTGTAPGSGPRGGG